MQREQTTVYTRKGCSMSRPITFEEAGHCLNALFAADLALNAVEKHLEVYPGTECGTDDAFQLLRLALSNFVHRYTQQCDRRGLGTDAEFVECDHGALLDTQRFTRDQGDPVAFTNFHVRDKYVSR